MTSLADQFVIFFKVTLSANLLSGDGVSVFFEVWNRNFSFSPETETLNPEQSTNQSVWKNVLSELQLSEWVIA